MTRRSREHIPLKERRDGKDVLLKFAVQFAYYKKDATPETLDEWDLWDFGSRVLPPKCKKCWDTGHVGAGSMPPYTGLGCECETAKSLEAERTEMSRLLQRVSQLEALLADKSIARGTTLPVECPHASGQTVEGNCAKCGARA